MQLRIRLRVIRHALPEMVPYLAYVLLGIPLPLTILQILAVDLGADMLPAFALGADPPNPAIMKQKPRKRLERLLNKSILMRAYLASARSNPPRWSVTSLFYMAAAGAGVRRHRRSCTIRPQRRA